MVRVGVDETLSAAQLALFPAGAEMVRLPSKLVEDVAVEFRVLPYVRSASPETCNRLQGLRVVQSMTAGVDAIVQWLPKDVVLCDGRGLHDISASEWVLAGVLGWMKRMPVYRDMQREQRWRSAAMPMDVFLAEMDAQVPQYPIACEDLEGKTVLIVGYGSIGAAIEARMAPFGVEVVRVARSARQEPLVYAVTELDALLPLADVVVLIVPSTEATRGMIGAREMARMKRGALLVNAARGSVVVMDALVEALREERIAAVVDVTDPEPLPVGHPLWSAPNCMITPHIGGATPKLIDRGVRLAAEQVRRYIAGEPLLNVVGADGY